jgi:hypothetical protein
MNPSLRDALLKKTVALPNGAATVQTTGLQIFTAPVNSEFLAEKAELLLEAPAVNTTELADTQTITYTVEGSNDDSTYVTVSGAAQLVQTGAGGVGAVAGTLRYRPPTNAYKYYRAKAVKAGASNASTSSLTFSLLV